MCSAVAILLQVPSLRVLTPPHQLYVEVVRSSFFTIRCSSFCLPPRCIPIDLLRLRLVEPDELDVPLLPHMQSPDMYPAINPIWPANLQVQVVLAVTIMPSPCTRCQPAR